MESSQIPLKDNIIFPYEDKHPKVAASVFLAPGVKIIGDVTIGEDSNVWFNSVIRGDIEYIAIGSRTNIQDGSILHVSKNAPVIIGSNVTVGHKACLHGCTVEDFALIGMSSTVLDGAVVQTKSMVAAGALVTPNFVVPTGKIVGGVPAKVLRDLTAAEMDYFSLSASHYVEYASKMKKNLL